VGALTMQIDPAPTATPSSDYSAIIVGGLIRDPGLAGHVSIEYAEQVKLTPARLKDRVDLLLIQNPRIRRVRIAATGGSATWRHVFRDLPGGVALELHGDHRSNSGRKGAPEKDLKFADLLERYERGKVWHAEHFTELEDQLKRWPEVEHDDLGDATSELVRELQDPKKPR
jgi:phage terminase large subunit-like protein